MGIPYEPDKNLEFLKSCAEEDLAILARYLTHDSDGSERFASSLLKNEKFRQFKGRPDKYRQCWELIAGELQHFGGDTIVNLFRRKGVLYEEIVRDVCDKLKIKLEKDIDIEAAEEQVCKYVFEKSWEKMSEKEKKELLNKIGLGTTFWAGATLGGAAIFQAAMQAGRMVSTEVIILIANAVATRFAGHSISVIGGLIGSRWATAWAGPIGIAVGTLLTVPAITGTAYRVTIPSVIQIAYMRKQYKDKNPFS